MEAVFTSLSRAVEGAPAIALGAAFAWGLLSVIFSPCHLASIPLIVGFMSEQKGMTVARAFRIALLFSLGVLASIALIGVVTAALGRMLGDVGGWVNYLVAAVFFVMGLHLLDVIPLPTGRSAGLPTARRGHLAALAIGLVYGVALGPCTFAYMAPVLAVAFKAGATAPLFAAALFTAFGLGHCTVITAAGTSVRRVQEYLRWSEDSRAVLIGRRVCGLLVLAGGLYFLYTAR
ncbi:MAG: cytochrome c biogenesis CcdA family protein [Candidatus Methylomirabilia bacterium]